MRLTSRQSISPWCVARRVFCHRREQQAARRSSRRHRHGTDCAAIPHPSAKLPPRKTARSHALTIEMSVPVARPPTAPESWLLSGISHTHTRATAFCLRKPSPAPRLSETEGVHAGGRWGPIVARRSGARQDTGGGALFSPTRAVEPPSGHQLPPSLAILFRGLIRASHDT